MKQSKLGARQLAVAAMLTAIVVVLQVVANFIQPVPGVSISLVLLPIVVGAALLGPWAGAWLGLAFAVTVLVSGGATAFFPISMGGTLITVIVKGVPCHHLRRHRLSVRQHRAVPGWLPAVLLAHHHPVGTGRRL